MAESGSEWTFLSNYAHVLVCLAQNSHMRLRDVADRVGITERTAVRLVTQLDEAGIVIRVKDGRRNRYLINTHKPLRHPIESHCSTGELLETILGPEAVRELAATLAAHTSLAPHGGGLAPI
ncbi:MAG: helix-turn-helix transcriptional regulator [Gammaproteobacteria bacterium]